MFFELSAEQRLRRAEFAAFADTEVAAHAARADHEGRLAPVVIKRLAAQGYLTPWLPRSLGGLDDDWLCYGLLTQEIGRACASTRMLITVQGMVAQAIMRWAAVDLRRQFLPRLASGELQAAFALSEANAGSDAERIETMAEARGDHYVLNGEKTWVSFGLSAGLILVCARLDGRPAAFLLEAPAAGLSCDPVGDLFGVRAAGLATLRLRDCAVPRDRLLAKPGFGFSHVAATALDHGRFGVAWGCVGLMRACLATTVRHTASRRQFGSRLRDLDLVRRIMSEIVTSVQCSELLCLRAALLRDRSEPEALAQTQLAKFYAATQAVAVANHAMQLHGAAGYSGDHPVQRYLRDARLMEVIEGTTQIHQLTVARMAYEEPSDVEDA